MPDDFLPHQSEFRMRVRTFVEQELVPRGEKWENERRFPLSILRSCARHEFISLDPERNAVVAEEIVKCESLGFAMSVFVQTSLVAPMLEELGTPGQMQQFLAPLLEGKHAGAMAVSEPLAWSDFAALKTRAEETRRGWRLNGVKTYITNAAIAQFIVVAAKTEPEAGLQGLSLFLVPVESKGVRVKPLPMLGLSTAATGEITLSNCEIPAKNLLGERGQAFTYIQAALNRERLFGGLACVSWAQYALGKTIHYVRNRSAFGSTLSRFQAVRHQIADLHSRLAAARQLNYSVFQHWLRGEQATHEICMVKLFSYQVAQQVVADCLQLHGGAGYVDDHWCSRFYRDARALTIAAGTPEIMREMIAAYLRL